MKISFSIAQAIIQTFFAQMILLGYSLYAKMDLPLAITTTTTLLFFLGLYQVAFGVLFFRTSQLTKLILIPLLSSLVTALTLALYPALGFIIDFWLLFGILFVAGIVACVLLFSAGASWRNNDYG